MPLQEGPEKRWRWSFSHIPIELPISSSFIPFQLNHSLGDREQNLAGYLEWVNHSGEKETFPRADSELGGQSSLPTETRCWDSPTSLLCINSSDQSPGIPIPPERSLQTRPWTSLTPENDTHAFTMEGEKKMMGVDETVEKLYRKGQIIKLIEGAGPYYISQAISAMYRGSVWGVQIEWRTFPMRWNSKPAAQCLATVKSA